MKQLRWKDFSLVSKIVIEVGMIAVLLFAMNMLFYVRINNSMQKMDNVYASNAELTELSQVFEKVQDNMYKYLKVKNSQTLLDYYQNEAKYRNELEKLNEDNINDPVKLLERNIRKMSETYLDCTAETVAAKRGRNVEQYKRKYDDATKLYRYIQSSIDELNNLMFQENSSTYAVLRAVMRYLEISNSVIMIIIVAGGMLLLIQATRNMFVPLSNMAETAQLVGQGNFHVKMHDTDAQDELGTVTRAFNTMVENLDLYMARTKASMEKEQQMMERELLMENHLKEAQLKYLQSQINPHFLFNSLNAGAQLAMMEDAERTGIFVEKMADFFRYNVKKGQEDATLGEELEAVDNYIYILNVRFAGDIHFSKEGDREVTPPAVRIAMIGIALGLAVMILSVAIVIGFKKEVRNKVIGFGSHIQITNFDSNSSYESQPIAVSDTLLNALDAFPGIRHVEKFATKLGILKTDQDFQGIVLKGVDTDYDWTFFKDNLKEGEIFTIQPDKNSTDVIISKYLSDLLGLKVGDSFLTYFVQDDVRARKFTITGIYETGFLDYDKMFVIADIKQIRRLNGWDKDQVSGLELQVDDYDRLDQVAEDIYFDLTERQDRNGNTFYARSIKELNPMIFNWLDVLDINVVVILALMLSVAGFTMISGLLIIILERTNMIGILKALGQNNNSIRKIFLYVSFFLIGKGMLWGNIIGISLCLLQSHFHIIQLDPSIYYLDAVPIDLSLFSLFLLNIGTLAASMLMMLGPSYLITKIDPAKSIRFE